MCSPLRAALIAFAFLAGPGLTLTSCRQPLVVSRGMFPPGSVDGMLSRPGQLNLDRPAFELKQVVLPSGLRVGYETAPTRGMVGTVLVIGTGSTEDPPGKEGLAHLVEHLTYHATHATPDGRAPIDATLARVGSTYNADTALDRTRYYEFAPASALPVLLRIEGQRLTHPLDGVAARDFEVERDIVRNELRQRNETGVYGQIVTWIQRALFPADHPYARSVSGTHESLAHLTVADARAFVTDRYRAPFATLLVVGELPAAAGLQQVLQVLPPGLTGDAAHPVPPVVGRTLPAPAFLPPAPTSGAETMKTSVAWPEIWIAYYLADLYGPHAPAMKLLTDDAIEGRVAAALRQDPDVGGVEMVALSARQATMLAFRITLLRSERRDAIATDAKGIIARLCQEADGDRNRRGDADEALWRDTKRAALTHTILDAEAFTSRAPARALSFHMTGAIDAYDRLIEALAEMPADAALPHAAYLLSADRARVLHVEPLPALERTPTGPVGLPSVTRVEGPRSGKGGGADAKAHLTLGADFGQAPSLPPVREILEAERYTLPNGMRVALLSGAQIPTVTVALGFGGGVAASPPGRLEMVRLLEGNGTFAMKANGVFVEKMDSDDLTADVATVGARNLSNALFMLGLRLRVLDEVRWPRVVSEAEGKLGAIDHESPATRASRAFWDALYPRHPYGRIVSVASLHDVKGDDVASWLPQIYTPSNATLVIAGGFNPIYARQVISYWFQGWRGIPEARPLEVAPPAPPRAGPPREQVVVTPRTGTSQVELTIGCRLPPPSDLPNTVTARMLGSAVGAQLERALRDEGGFSYGVSASVGALRGGAVHMVLNADIDSARFAEALGIVRERWAELGRVGFDPGSLSQVRWTTFKAAALRFQTSRDLAVTELGAANENWSPAALSQLPALADHVTAAQLASAFAVCRANTVLSLLGDETVIRAALADGAVTRAAGER